MKQLTFSNLFLGMLAVLFICFLIPHEPSAAVLATAPLVVSEEMKTLLADIAKETKQTIKIELDALLKGLVTREDFDKRMEAIKLSEENYTKLHKALQTQGNELRKLIEAENGGSYNKETALQILQKHKDAILALKSANGVVKFEMTRKALTTRSDVSGNTQALRLTDIGTLPYLGVVLQSLFRPANIGAGNNGTIRYIDQAAITRGADNVAEAAQKPESAITWIERLLPVEKIADSIPVSKEALEDLDYIQSELDRLLNINLQLKLDQQLYKGTGVTPQMKGVFTSAPVFVTTPYTGSVNFANIYDLISTLRTDITNGTQGKGYQPNVVLMNPIDTRKMKLTKNVDGDYIIPPFANAAGQVVDSVRIVETSQVAANELLIGDFRFGTYYQREGISMSMGFVDKQFVENTITMLAEMRAALLIRVVDEGAFRKVTNITTALAALETP